ncbi:LANO_0F11584g1_1 [Lachancea nothofagi CBS 11611]|uniref:LANO_0F11584g1_1 n=1 Tax=Lachancea nothofagi CBS 11611 TaxID=1266666 RepID=A0A1G4KAW6_9SACH|nr:LANO_0F11584g1_1 [Lachancea nothofagi CBS 11611]
MKALRAKDTNVAEPRGNRKYKIEKRKLVHAKKQQPAEAIFKNSMESFLEVAPLSGSKVGSPELRPRSSDMQSNQDSIAAPDTLSQHALEHLQFTICEREMDTTSCGHPFCHRLKRVKLPLTDFRNLLLFDLEMIPEQFKVQLTNLRNGCYRNQVYQSIWSDWKLPPNLNGTAKELNKLEEFSMDQLFIGECAPTSPLSSGSNLKTTDRVRSRRNVMPHSFLAQRNQSSIFEEPLDPAELLRESSSISVSLEEKAFDNCRMHRHNKLGCVLAKDPKISNDEEFKSHDLN